MTVRSTGASPPCGQSNSPNDAVPVASTVPSTVDGMSRRPPPTSYAVSPASGLAVLTSACLIWSPVQSGCCWAMIAAAPATCGVAIEVPDIDP